MALQLLRVIALGVLAAAATDDVPTTIWDGAPLECRVPQASRRPPPPLHSGDHRRARVYSWTHNGEDVPSKRISQNGSLEITKRSGEGLYQCAVKNHAGVVLGYPIQLKFPSMDKQFLIQPDNVTAKVGQPVVLTCQITSTPPAVVSWLRDEDPIPEDPRYHVLTNQLLIVDVKKEDAGHYRCAAFNKPMNKTRVSHKARLLVEVTSSDIPPSLLETHHEGNLTVERWSRVVLPCPVLGRPRPEVIWQFTFPDGRVGELDAVEQVLVLPRVELDEEGVYTCTVPGTGLKKTFNVTITEPVTILIPPANKEAIRAKTVRFNCTASGRPEPVIEWYKDGEKLPPAGRAKVLKNSDRLELVISTVTKEDAGVYQCMARSGSGWASAWAALAVPGAGAPPPVALRCRPAAARALQLLWAPPPPAAGGVVAYTLHYASAKKSGSSQPIQPQKSSVMKETVTVEEALTPYKLQVRAYVTSSEVNVASDMSRHVLCQGQGVPIKIVKLHDNQLMATWHEFALQNPGVLEWQVQYKRENSSEVRNETLGAQVFEYNFHDPSETPLLVRVLGTKVLPWLQQDLSLVPWTSTAQALEHSDRGEPPVPTDVQVSDVSPQGFTVKWRCDEVDMSPDRYVYVVCIRKREIHTEDCSESYKSTFSVDGLEADTQYWVRVQARRGRAGEGGAGGGGEGGPFSSPYPVHTLSTETQRFKDISYKFLNGTSVMVWWGGPDSQYKVHYSSELKLPVDVWITRNIYGNNVTFNLEEGFNKTFVMVTGFDPYENSKILTINHINDLKNLSYQYTSDGIQVSWQGAASMRYSVKYSQRLTLPMEQWADVNVTQPVVELRDLDPGLPTHVTVTSLGSGRKSQTLTIPPPPPKDKSSLYIGIGVGASVVALVIILAALCIWRRRKQSRSPLRSRRRNSNQGNEEGASEMTSVGGRLANGAAFRGVDEPLLNGHVHITENPTLSKTPNGKTKKSRRHEQALDVSRYEPDVTAETVLEDLSLSTVSRDPIDASRPPDPTNYNKLPDDNMNSELIPNTDYIDDNSTTQPTLQPNG